MIVSLLLLILVGPVILVSQLEPGRFIATPLAAVGLVGGLLCLGSKGKTRFVAALAAFLHFSTLIVLLLFPSWLNLDPWQSETAKSEQKEPQGPLAVPNAGGPGQPADWVDGTNTSWVYADIQASVRGASLAPVELVGPQNTHQTTPEPYLQLSIRLMNNGVERRIKLSEWATGASRQGVRLSDSAGKEVPVKMFPAGWLPEREKPAPVALFPHHWADVLIVFAVPTSTSGDYQLELSGAAVGVPHPIRFRFASEFFGLRP